MKYPLTENAKKAAYKLVEDWDAGHIKQHTSSRSSNTLSTSDVARLLYIDDYAVLLEFSKYGLIEVNRNYSTDGRLVHVDILLLQELRNAITTDFEVSDYFLTLNAVGNIIINSTTGNVQGIGYSSGTTSQTIEALADDLLLKLGSDFLQVNTELKDAIEGLKTASSEDKKTWIAKIMNQLGNSLIHGAAAGTIITALPIIEQALQRLGG